MKDSINPKTLSPFRLPQVLPWGCWPRRAHVYVSVPHCGNDASSPNSSRALRALARRSIGGPVVVRHAFRLSVVFQKWR